MGNAAVHNELSKAGSIFEEAAFWMCGKGCFCCCGVLCVESCWDTERVITAETMHGKCKELGEHPEEACPRFDDAFFVLTQFPLNP